MMSDDDVQRMDVLSGGVVVNVLDYNMEACFRSVPMSVELRLGGLAKSRLDACF